MTSYLKEKIDDMTLDKEVIFWGSHYEKFVEWHPTLTCPDCGDKMYCGDRMYCGDMVNFIKKENKQWLCRSNLYMEGGC